jgi:hypothetical protein
VTLALRGLKGDPRSRTRMKEREREGVRVKMVVKYWQQSKSVFLNWWTAEILWWTENLFLILVEILFFM